MTGISSGNVRVTIGNGAGGNLTPEQVAEIATGKIIAAADSCHPAIKEQARLFSNKINKLVAHYINQSVLAEKSRISAALRSAGNLSAADLVERL